MKIKARKSFSYKKALSSFVSYLLSKKVKIFIKTTAILIALIAGVLLGLIASGFFGTLDNPSPKLLPVLTSVAFGKPDWVPGDIYDYYFISQSNFKIPINYIKGLFAKKERIYIDIPFMSYQKLAYKRQEALKKGWIISEEDDYVPIVIRYKDKSLNGKARLKGDGIDNLAGEKWSLRVKLSDENTLFGMRVFSLQHPGARRYAYEWVFHEMLKKEGIIGLRYDFVDVVLNGKSLGIYALEEHFEKRLIENNERREGPILGFDEDLDIKTLQQIGERVSFESAPIKLYKPSKTLNNLDLYKAFLNAKNNLEAFRHDKVDMCEVFDCKLFARYFAVLDILSAQHAAKYGNLKFYYNPVTSLIEPIAFDAEILLTPVPHLLEAWQNYERTPTSVSFFNRIFSNEEFFKLYMAELERVSQESYLDEFFSDVDEELNNKINIIYKSYPHYSYSNNLFYKNQRYVRNLLNPVTAIYGYYEGRTNDAVILDIGNVQKLPIEIVSINYNGSLSNISSKDNLLNGLSSNGIPEYKKMIFKVPRNLDFSASDLSINFRLVGLNNIMNQSVFPWRRFNENFMKEGFIKPKSNINHFNFITISKNSILIKEGNWNINKNLIIPEGYTVYLEPGTTLNLLNGAKIISYSGLRFIGTRESPIYLKSSDGTGQGLIVIDADVDSILEYTIFDGLSEPNERGWHLTGSVTFYESNVKFYEAGFQNSKSEDALNIVRSDFDIRYSTFENTFSDCFDSDFSNGIVKNTYFSDCGNDALDFSGSYVNVSGITVVNAGDKGLSSGEKSHILVKNLNVSGSKIGLASKDSSTLKANKIHISNSEYGILAYQKKSEYGPASIEIYNLNANNGVTNKVIVEDGSNIILDGKRILQYEENLYEKIYGVS